MLVVDVVGATQRCRCMGIMDVSPVSACSGFTSLVDVLRCVHVRLGCTQA